MKRIQSVDTLRGITIIGMIIVNNAGGKESFDSLRHSAWNGLTPCDLVYPFFLFILGISTYLALNKFEFKPSLPLYKKIVKRALLILLIGWAIHWFDACLKGDYLPFDHLRLTGVLPRIALCYGITAFIALTIKHRYLPWIAGAMLGCYGVLLIIGNGYRPDATNLLAQIDSALLGNAHLYTKHPIDPEGVVSTIGALAHTLIGFCLGKYVVKANEHVSLLKLFAWGSLLLITGYLLVELWPINKRIWSPSFTLITCGLGTLLLSTLTCLEQQGKPKKNSYTTRICLIYGVNPLALYVLSELLAIILKRNDWQMPLYNAIHAIITNPYLASMTYSLLFTAVVGLVGLILYKKRIYIKL